MVLQSSRSSVLLSVALTWLYALLVESFQPSCVVSSWGQPRRCASSSVVWAAESDAVGAVPKVQTMDYTTLLRVSQELQPLLVPGRFEQSIQTDDFTTLLQFKSMNGLHWLLLCWQPEAARVTIAQRPPPAGASTTAYSLPAQLRSVLQTRTLVGVVMPMPGERIMCLDFADRVTDSQATHRLYIEIMGRRSNVALVDMQDSKVLACGYQVSPSKSVRTISLGQAYVVPPPQLTPIPSSLHTTEDDFIRKVSLVPTYDLRKALLSTYRGLSPQLADVMAQAVGLSDASMQFSRKKRKQWFDPSTPRRQVQKVSDDLLRRLFQGPFNTWLQLIEGKIAPAGPHRPGRSLDGSRYTPLVFAEPQGAWEERDSMLEVVSSYYEDVLTRQELMSLKRQALHAVDGVLKRLCRMREEFLAQLRAADEEQIEALQAKADMLTSYAFSWKEGDRDVLCYDFSTGEPVRIAVAEGRSAAEEAQNIYRRIRKLRRSGEAVTPLLEQLEVRVAYVEELQDSIERLGGEHWLGGEVEVMREIAEEVGLGLSRRAGDGRRGSFFASILNLASAGGGQEEGRTAAAGAAVWKPATQGNGGKGAGANKGGASRQQKQQQAGQGGKSQQQGVINIRCFQRPGAPPDAPVVYVGRNSRQNDYVTFSMAKPHELWFHARGVPGSHCLLRYDAGREVSDEDVQFAADLAAYFSKGRTSENVPVSYTSPKFLKKAPGGAPGMVQVLKEKVVWGRASAGGEAAAAQTDEGPRGDVTKGGGSTGKKQRKP